MIHNLTINKQINHRSIRKFKNESLDSEQLTTLYTVFQHTATSMFMQNASLLHITDQAKREKIRELCGQKYVGAEGDLFIFIVDLYRNQQIRQQLNKDDGRVHTTDIFFQAMEDTLLAWQNVANAVESMELGYVPLGTINDHPLEMLAELDLPPLTFPVLGMQVGIPDQEPQLKPRLPLEFTTFENEYPRDFKVDKLHDYDQVVTTYYDLRDSNKRIDSFTKQITGAKLDNKTTDRDQLPELLHQQGLCLDWK
ncbi:MULTISPECIES: NADPH-dependent oxidoreductase [unclassified Lactobacillus]|uniref:NADPH-dependent oxidoreductase n=1 Tax=unclassified Lactobacillus TaxID=2620435 RepID=UPI002269A701|nr:MULTISPECIES: NADPH-dependent oxidoreductase [unclassified Lactobacillus]MCX8720890.1 NADPH-dependent oxidoreductase [Lactobacillus sp. B4010]MCX8733037.1 NADPH-dependent oxidoreductase [Lactobacillus sp. B4015]MCX8735243.1 NADPH-dependent oxidoreductase [Lactobacillus sp. B4012]